MRPAAVALVLVSAVAHVYWNAQVKRSPAPAIYTWWLQAAGAVLFAPVAVWIAWPVSIPAAGWFCVAATALIYAAYFSLIARSYDHDDLSRAYPVARGIAPVATAAWGVLFHQENPSPAGWMGIAAISAGVVWLAGSPLRSGRSSLPAAGVVAAIGTGLCTSAYSAVDKEGVKHVAPVLYIVLTYSMGAAAQGTLLWRGRGWRAFAAEAGRDRRGILMAAGACLGSYLLVLLAFRMAPVSYVVPLRSVSVLLGVLVGTRLLGEAGGAPRLGAAALVVAGMVAIAAAG